MSLRSTEHLSLEFDVSWILIASPISSLLYDFLSRNSGWALQLHLKKDSGRGAFLWILQNFQEHLFHRTPAVAASVSAMFPALQYSFLQYESRVLFYQWFLVYLLFFNWKIKITKGNTQIEFVLMNCLTWMMHRFQKKFDRW